VVNGTPLHHEWENPEAVLLVPFLPPKSRVMGSTPKCGTMEINRRELLSAAIPAALGTTLAVGVADVPAAIVGTQAVPTIEMGLGELGSPSNIFVREFRFLFWFDHMGPEFNHSITFDRVKREIKFKSYEIYRDGKVLIQDWTDAMVNGAFPDETMTLATYDGCGTELYRKRFTGLKVKACTNSFNCSSSECALPEVTLSYETYKDVPVGSEQHPTQAKEIQIDHLNGRSWIL